MGRFKDLTGQKFGRLTVVKRVEDYVSPKGHKEPKFEVLCTCGCYHKEVKSKTVIKRSTIHGHCKRNSKTKTFRIWSAMLSRCNNSNNKKYYRYGARGIKVCERWKEYKNFLADMGECPEKHSIERINNNGNYEPENCKWATAKEQMNNMSSNRLLTWHGESKTVQQWSEITKIKSATIRARIDRGGWSIEKALSTNTLNNNNNKKLRVFTEKESKAMEKKYPSLLCFD
ncbi:MAG: hypothetical protein ACRDBG_22465 [Waterburya sp.]